MLEGYSQWTKKLPRVLAVVAWFGLTVLVAWLGYAAVAIVVSAIFGMDVDGALYFLFLRQSVPRSALLSALFSD